MIKFLKMKYEQFIFRESIRLGFIDDDNKLMEENMKLLDENIKLDDKLFHAEEEIEYLRTELLTVSEKYKELQES